MAYKKLFSTEIWQLCVLGYFLISKLCSYWFCK